MAIVLDGNNLLTTGAVNVLPTQTASGSAVSFTGIPAGVRRVTLNWAGLVGTGNYNLLIQLGTSSGVTTSGYATTGAYYGSSAGAGNYTTGWSTYGWYITYTSTGTMIFNLLGSNIWVGTATYAVEGQIYGQHMMGRITLASALTTVYVTTASNGGVFTGGSLNVMYE